MNNLVQRILTGIVFIAAILLPIWYGPLANTLLFFAVALLSLHEFYGIIKADQRQPDYISGFLAAVLMYVGINAPCLFPEAPWAHYLHALVLPGTALIFFAELYRKKEQPFTNIAYTLLGVLYAVLPFALLNEMSFAAGTYDRGILLGFFFILWSSDTFAYVFGMLFGQHRLFERISPKKSWEGSIGGGLTTLAFTWLISVYQTQYSFGEWVVAGLIIIITGTYGDLTESMLKRSLQVKDSGSILPGHGGLLDRFDGLFLSVPFLWAWFHLIR